MSVSPLQEPRLIRLSAAHIPQLLRLERRCFAAPWSAEAYRREFAENALAHYYGLVQARRLIAYGGFWQILDEGHIVNVAVHPDFQRKGLGELIVRHLLAASQALGAHAITLEVRESNTAAKRLYEKMGFKSAGTRPHYYDDGENAIIMWVKV